MQLRDADEAALGDGARAHQGRTAPRSSRSRRSAWLRRALRCRRCSRCGVGGARRRADHAARRHRRARRHRLGARVQGLRPLRRGRSQGRAAHQALPQLRRRRRARDGRARAPRASSTASPRAHSSVSALAPSMRVLRLPGVFQSRDEARDVVDAHAVDPRRRGAPRTASSSSAPPASDPTSSSRASRCARSPTLRRMKLWRWDVDELGIAASREMGLTIVPLRSRRRAPRLRRRAASTASSPRRRRRWRSSGRRRRATSPTCTRATSTAAWCSASRSSSGCAPELQAALRAGAARMLVGIEELGRRQDEQLLGGLFAKQGLKTRAGLGVVPRRVLRGGQGGARSHLRSR